VLAAGTGSRLVNGQPLPKPLKRVAGVPLLVRVLRVLQDEGIREAVIVIGHQGEPLRRALLAEPSLGLTLTFVRNDRFDLKNGVSLLAARAYVGDGALLTMADHLYSPEIVRRLRAMDLPRGASALAVDFDIERCFDLDDATKVQVEQGRIANIGKEIAGYNALDTGVFRIGPELIDELSRLHEKNGDCSLSEGVHALAARGAFYACDAGDARWIDVDTPEALQKAEAMIQVFGDELGDDSSPTGIDINPEGVQLFAPSWVRAAQPYGESDLDLGDAALCARLGRREGLDDAHVLLGAGPAELVDVAVRTFVGPGEEVLITAPSPSLCEARARTAGGIPVVVPTDEAGDLDVPALIGAVTERTKLVFLGRLDGPSGRVEEAAIRRVLRLGLPTVVDEAHCDASESTGSLSFLLHEFPNAIVLRSFPKALGLSGMRLGYTLSHPVITKLLARVKVPWTVASVAVAAASAALEDAPRESLSSRQLA